KRVTARRTLDCNRVLVSCRHWGAAYLLFALAVTVTNYSGCDDVRAPRLRENIDQNLTNRSGWYDHVAAAPP
ncbi:MAG: hypothetical protein WCA55_19375, partial [Xanthobacteraceae bacterium]